MNLLDLILLLILASFVLMSASRGAQRELATWVGLLLGYGLAVTQHHRLGQEFGQVLKDERLADLLAYISIILVTYLISTLFTGLGSKLALAADGLANRLVGAAMGLCKGGIMAMVMFTVISLYVPGLHGLLEKSTAAPHLQRILERIAF